MIDCDNFRLSLKRLEQQHENYRQLDDSFSGLTREAVAESAIRRFKTCYDCLWRVLKRYLIEELGIADAPRSPKPIFRLAYENGLFAEPLEQWFGYIRARISAGHDYSGEKVQSCLLIMPDFISDATGIYETVSGTRWE